MGRKVMQAVADWLDRFSGRALAAAIAFVLVVDGAYAVHFRSRIRFFDEGDYLAIAKNLASGRGFSIDGSTVTARRSPAFPALLGVFRAADVPVTALRLVNVILLAGTVWMAWTLANRLGGRAAAALAALATSVYPLHVFTASTFYPETLATALLLGGVLCAAVADETKTAGVHGRTGWFGASGLLLSLLILTSPTYAVAALVVLLWFAWRHRRAGLGSRLRLPDPAVPPRGRVDGPKRRRDASVRAGHHRHGNEPAPRKQRAHHRRRRRLRRHRATRISRTSGIWARSPATGTTVPPRSTTSRTTLVEVQSSSARRRSTTSAHSTDCTRGASHRPHEAGSRR